jgi:hypothetical protein
MSVRSDTSTLVSQWEADPTLATTCSANVAIGFSAGFLADDPYTAKPVPNRQKLAFPFDLGDIIRESGLRCRHGHANGGG